MNWTQHQAAVGPYADAFICFHAGRGKVVLQSSSVYPSYGHYVHTLKEWDGVQWVDFWGPGNLPGTASFESLLYDASRDKLVTFGARPGSLNPLLPETWEWDAASGWVQVGTSGPLSAHGVRLVYDEARGTQVMFAIISLSCQVWERVGAGPWVRNPAGDGTWSPGSLAYDQMRRRIVLLGLSNSMASWEPVHPASYDAHGLGCPGSLGTPTLSLTHPWTLPRLGGTLDVSLGGLPQSVGVLAMGFQDQMVGTVPLPADLTGLGMPGCSLRVPLDATVFVLGANQQARFQLVLPPASLLGVRFFQQGFSLDPGQNPLGVAMTGSRLGIVGAW